METEDVLEWLGNAWNWVKKCVKYNIETNFTCMEDFFFFIALFGTMIFVVIIVAAGAYDVGYDHGETAGLIRGFASGTNYMAP